MANDSSSTNPAPQSRHENEPIFFGAVLAPPVSEEEKEGQYQPRPCVLEQREIVEYPTLVELPESISSTLGVLSDEAFDADEDHDPSEHWSQVHQGSKVGGWAFWYQQSLTSGTAGSSDGWPESHRSSATT